MGPALKAFVARPDVETHRFGIFLNQFQVLADVIRQEREPVADADLDPLLRACGRCRGHYGKQHRDDAQHLVKARGWFPHPPARCAIGTLVHR